jgi:hypothetical protein
LPLSRSDRHRARSSAIRRSPAATRSPSRRNFDKGTLYATVDRYDNKQYRELYATPAAVDAVRKGQPIPSGTVLTLVQYKAQLDAAGEPLKDATAVSRRATSSPTR